MNKFLFALFLINICSIISAQEFDYVKAWNECTSKESKEENYVRFTKLKEIWSKWDKKIEASLCPAKHENVKNEILKYINDYNNAFNSKKYDHVIAYLEFYRDSLNEKLDDDKLEKLLKSYLLSISTENIGEATDILKKTVKLKNEKIDGKNIFPDYYKDLIISDLKENNLSTTTYFNFAIDIDASFISSFTVGIVQEGFKFKNKDLIKGILNSSIEKDSQSGLKNIELIFDEIIDLCISTETISEKKDQAGKTVACNFVSKILEKSSKNENNKKKFIMGKLLKRCFEKRNKNNFNLLEYFIDELKLKGFKSGNKFYGRLQYKKAEESLKQVLKEEEFDEESIKFVYSKIKSKKKIFNVYSSLILISLILYVSYLIRREIKKIKWR